MLKGGGITDDAYGGGGAGLDSYHEGFGGEESPAGAAEGLEAFAEAGGDEFWHPEMEWGGDESGLVGRLREVGGEPAADEVGHSLGWGCLCASALYPALVLEVFLETEHGEGVGSGSDVFGLELYYHSAVAPWGVAETCRHAVDYYLFGTAGCGYDSSAGTHAEGIDSSAGYLGNEGVLGCGKVLALAFTAVVLYLVDEVCGMFEPDSYCYVLGLDFYVLGMEPAVNVAG